MCIRDSVMVVIGLWGVGSYNGLVARSQAVDSQWAQVQSVYQRRADLVPNLVSTVSGAANFEKSTLTEITQARASVGQIKPGSGKAPTDPAQLAEFQRAQDGLSSALSRLLVVAGPNGSGKTSVTEQGLRHEWFHDCLYLNPDNIARDQFGDWNSPDAILQAARLADTIREEAIAKRTSLAFETVLSSEGKIDYLRRAKEAGYFIRLFFVGTESPAINAARITKRFMDGGTRYQLARLWRDTAVQWPTALMPRASPIVRISTTTLPKLSRHSSSSAV
mgnify:CR=1 FL=1